MERDSQKLLLARLQDEIRASQKHPCFFGFLNEEEGAVCEELLRREPNLSFAFWGGYEEAERKLLGLFPEYMEPEYSSFPLTALTFSFREQDALSHRDFLGSFMSLGIERDTIGDILLSKGRCVTFVRRELESYFCLNIQKIGRVGVRVIPGIDGGLPIEKEYQTLSGVIASPRLDCMVAFLCRLGRDKAAKLISAGLVMRNHKEILSVSERVQEEDILSIRGYGKFLIDRLGPLTAKGRLSVQCRKYK